MYMLCRPDIQEYKTIHAEDVEIFYDIVKNDLFDKEDKNGVITKYENKLELITDKSEIKKVLDEKYSSRSRGEQYTPGLPSATVISSGLFPLDIDYKNPKSKFNRLRWWNNTSLEDMNAQKIKNKLSTDSGTLIHKVIEIAMCSNDRTYLKKRSLNKYIELACQDKEIIDMIDNFEDRKQYFIDMASKTLKKFFENEIEYIYPVFSELYIKLPNKIQGAIDMICWRNGKLTIMDWKTSKKAKSRNQLIDCGYLRQLYIYSRMLYLDNIITKKELDNLNFTIGFYNWNSCNSYMHDFEKEEINKNKAYVNFVYNWYHQIMNENTNIKYEL